MNAQAVEKPINWLSQKLRNAGFSEGSQFDVKLGRIYEVHAVAIWAEIPLFQIVGESGIISWLPAIAFEIKDRSLPNDWLVNHFDEEVPLIIGPGFVSDSKEAYSEMVELHPDRVRQFMSRLEGKGNEQ